MKRLFERAAFPLAISSALVCVGCRSDSTASSPASSGSAAGTYMFCYTNSPSHGVTVSAVFRLPSVDQVTMLEEPWAKDFRRYVGESGDAGAISVACDQVDPRNSDTAVKAKIDAWRKQGTPVAQVNWKYAGG